VKIIILFRIGVMALLIVTSSNLFPQTEKDTLLIKGTALNYIEGLYTNNYERMEKALHPELAKRVIKKDENGNYRLSNMGYSELIYYSKAWKPKFENPEEEFKADIIIFDISNDIATIKVTQNKYNFFDYIHLGKIDGEWKIINLLWARPK
jgi:hypothetical protein|tara:strand:- start:2843 stop:3295 length:453 start_codon:yes stop_codon:yes gene_type:complete